MEKTCRTTGGDLDDITSQIISSPMFKATPSANRPILGQSMATENTSFFTPKKGSENRNGNLPGYFQGNPGR